MVVLWSYYSSSEAADGLQGPRTQRSWTLLPSGRRLPCRRQASGYIWASGKRLKGMLRLTWLSIFSRFISLYSLGSCSYDRILGWKRRNVLVAAISGTMTKGHWARASSRDHVHDFRSASWDFHCSGFLVEATSPHYRWKTLLLAVLNAAFNVHCSRASVYVYARLFHYRQLLAWNVHFSVVVVRVPSARRTALTWKLWCGNGALGGHYHCGSGDLYEWDLKCVLQTFGDDKAS